MKKTVTILLAIISLAMLLTVAANADVLVEPNNDFYSQHARECSSLERTYYANGKRGYVTLRKEPGSGSEIASLRNGELIYIMFTYDHKGELWGVTERRSTDDTYFVMWTGWVAMSDLTVAYDYIEFDREHSGEFYQYSGEPNTTGDIIFWKWPGSGVINGELGETWRHPGDAMNDVLPSHAYLDPEGREWGFVGYMYGRRNAWFCISDPTNREIAAFNTPPAPQLWPAADPDAIPSPNRTADNPDYVTAPEPWNDGLIVVIILVAAVVIGTAVLIGVLWKRKKT